MVAVGSVRMKKELRGMEDVEEVEINNAIEKFPFQILFRRRFACCHFLSNLRTQTARNRYDCPEDSAMDE